MMKKILVVEDNEDNRDMLTRRLERRGYRVEMAVNGLNALEVAQATHPDLILMDLSMPVMDGWDATRRLKAAPDLNHIPIIALTGHAMKDDRDKALASGAEDYLAKPLDFPRLLELVERWLRTTAQRGPS
jgi:two-component system, cell cycle response regulator DivK